MKSSSRSSVSPSRITWSLARMCPCRRRSHSASSLVAGLEWREVLDEERRAHRLTGPRKSSRSFLSARRLWVAGHRQGTRPAAGPASGPEVEGAAERLALRVPQVVATAAVWPLEGLASGRSARRHRRNRCGRPCTAPRGGSMPRWPSLSSVCAGGEQLDVGPGPRPRVAAKPRELVQVDGSPSARP